MENAAKALLIAGSIFLAIALITFGVYIYQSMHDMANAQDEKREQEQLVAFNKKYEAYNKSVMYGVDLITLMNMANEDSIKNGYDISIEFKFKTATSYTNNTDIYYGLSDYNQFKDNEDAFNDFKRRIFKCEKDQRSYDNYGRICIMRFIEVELTDYTV